MRQVARRYEGVESPVDPEIEAAELQAGTLLRDRNGILLTRTRAQREAIRRLADAEDAETVGRAPEALRP